MGDAPSVAQKLAQAARKVDAGWTEQHAHAVEAAMHRRLRRRARTRGALLASAATLLVLLSVAQWRRHRMHAAVAEASPSATPSVAQPGDPAGLRFADGSRVLTRDAATSARTASEDPSRVVVELARGAARVEVMPSAARVFRVEAGAVALEARGGAFGLERLDGDKVAVHVEQGRVLVLWGLEESALGEGDSGVFPRDRSPAEAATATSAQPASPSPSGRAVWRRQAQDGDFDQAFQSLQSAGSGAVRDEPGDLLLAADVARLSHHPAEAIAPLRMMLKDHAKDPRAPLAAFTLGRVLLEELGRPADAADAFARARALAPDGPMAEDALAREVESWSRAGDSSRAHDAAELYLAKYPGGRRVRSVRRFGGVE